MYVGRFGIPFNGETWDDFCQKCFSLKYQAEGYQKMPAYAGGDYGIEGFTKSGKVFQSYCPNVHINPGKLYEEQRDKITTDIIKIVRNEAKLKHCLNGVLIKNWIFYTPDLLYKELVEHAIKKTNEVRGMNCKILAPDFDILIHDFDHLVPFVEPVLGSKPKQLSFSYEKTIVDTSTDWAASQISLIENSIRKSKARLSMKNMSDEQLSEKANSMTDRNVKNFLLGDSILQKWNLHFPEMLSTFYSLKGAVEARAQDICDTTSDSTEAYRTIESMVEEKLSKSFSNIDESTRMLLCSHLMADWILRCPIEFA